MLDNLSTCVVKAPEVFVKRFGGRVSLKSHQGLLDRALSRLPKPGQLRQTQG